MTQPKFQNKHRFLTAVNILCSLLYVFAYQFKISIDTDYFLYGMVATLIAMTVIEGRVVVTKHILLFVLVDMSVFIGLIYTTNYEEGLREAVLFLFYAGLFALSMSNPAFIRIFVVGVFWASVVVVLSSILHSFVPEWFNNLMSRILKENPYETLMWSYRVDHTFAGLAAFTPNTTFSAAIVCGHSFLCVVQKEPHPIIKNRFLNMLLMIASMYSIIICSKRGIFVAVLAALFVLLCHLYRNRQLLARFAGVAVLIAIALVILYNTNDFAAAFLNRFIAGDLLTGRDVIYGVLIDDFVSGNIFVGRGTGAVYYLAEHGAHNIYLQILYDHGFVLGIPYIAFLLYNYYSAFSNKCPISIYVQTMFLVYGLSGNPLYSNMFMIIYIYYVLYATQMPLYMQMLQAGQSASTLEKGSNEF